MDRAVVVLGASGLIGSAVAQSLLKSGWEVTATVRDATSGRHLGDSMRDASIAVVDPMDWQAVTDLLMARRPVAVVSCIGRNAGAGAGAARACADANVTTVAILLDAMSRAGIGRAVVIGSGSEYEPADHPLDEKHPLGPTTLYGATKVAASEIATYFGRCEGMDVCVARPFSVYGPREPAHRFVPYVIGCGLSGRPMEISRGTQNRDYLYSADLADGLVRLVELEARLPHTLNFSGPMGHSLLDVAVLVRELTQSDAPILAGSRAPNPGDREVLLGDSQLARQLLGWEPSHDLRRGLGFTVEWYRTHPEFLGGEA